jgi:hypothetical protein
MCAATVGSEAAATVETTAGVSATAGVSVRTCGKGGARGDESAE